MEYTRGGSVSGSVSVLTKGSVGGPQLERLALSRQSSQPHHHARVAAAAARTSTTSTTNLSPSPPPTKDSRDTSDDPPASGWSKLDLGGMAIKNLSPAIFLYRFLTTLYLNHNNLSYLSHHVADLKSLIYLDLSGNKLNTVPPELGAVVSLKELLLFDNQIAFLPVELGNLYQLEVFGLEGNPLGEPYVGFMQKEGALAIIGYLRENIPAGPHPNEREWVTLSDDPAVTEGNNAFTVLCYNTLCDKYATPQTYAYTPTWALAWDYRKELIFHEIINYNADIVCLQEMETIQFEEYFQEQFLQVSDYEGVFWPKSRARTMGEYERRGVDGCATFFRSTKFRLVEKHTIEFQQIAMQRPELRRTEDVFNRVMVKDNIGLITVLESKTTPHFQLIVVNTHLHWDPSDSDVKLVQTAMLLEELSKIVSNYTPHIPLGSNKPAPPHPPIVFCGDFNSLPRSGVHDLLSTGSVPKNHPDFGKYTYGSYTREGISHPFNLSSAYNVIGELEFTNLTPQFRGVIDYIWVSGQSLSVTGLLGNVDKEYVKSGGVVGFPNAHHPSDHVPIMASLFFKGSGSEKEKEEKGKDGSKKK
ncbi:UNVERIFIED_CONTAM: Glucose-repressible alcohol dehydrogenase transcriptional effector [Siphonaria sp. JEL0065]|nr:Glucose-repressible alcohol dehydrogenase transcriptional effector [Siphonaria sp. JEL0065]